MLPREPEHREHAISRRAAAREIWKSTEGMDPETRRQIYHQQVDQWDAQNPNTAPPKRRGYVIQQEEPHGIVYNNTRWF